MSVHRPAPLPTDHARAQWRRRGDPAVRVRDAWRDATPSHAASHHLGVDEARYHAPTDTLLIRDQTRLVTVYERRDRTVWTIIDRRFEGP